MLGRQCRFCEEIFKDNGTFFSWPCEIKLLSTFCLRYGRGQRCASWHTGNVFDEEERLLTSVSSYQIGLRCGNAASNSVKSDAKVAIQRTVFYTSV